MKFHYIYFIPFPVLMVVALMLPFQIDTYNGFREISNGFDDGVTSVVFLVPTMIATTLLVIRNRVTAIIGACTCLIALGLATYMNVVLNYMMNINELGIGPFVILLLTLIATILSTIHTVKLFKTYKRSPKANPALIDEILD